MLLMASQCLYSKSKALAMVYKAWHDLAPCLPLQSHSQPFPQNVPPAVRPPYMLFSDPNSSANLLPGAVSIMS